MDRTFKLTEWKPQARTGKPWRALFCRLHHLPTETVHGVSFNRCLASAAENSGLDDYELADRMAISHGYMSKFMRAVAQQWARRLVAYMRHTNSIAPLQWIAAQMGCDIVVRSGQAAEATTARVQLADQVREQRTVL